MRSTTQVEEMFDSMENTREIVELAARRLRGTGTLIERFVEAGIVLAKVHEGDLRADLRPTYREVKARVINLRGKAEEIATRLEDIARAIGSA